MDCGIKKNEIKTRHIHIRIRFITFKMRMGYLFIFLVKKSICTYMMKGNVSNVVGERLIPELNTIFVDDVFL